MYALSTNMKQLNVTSALVFKHSNKSPQTSAESQDSALSGYSSFLTAVQAHLPVLIPHCVLCRLKKKNHFPFWVKASILLQPCGAYSPRLVHSRGPIKLPSVREQEHKVSCHQSHKVRAWQRIEYNLIALQQTN